MVEQSDGVWRFWFEELSPKQWFNSDAALDREVADRFAVLHGRAARCELYGWRADARGRLAEILVLDQFSRNIYRDRPEAFACDALALGLAQEAVACGADDALPPEARSFLYMPYMHSESPIIHAEAERLFAQPGLENSLDFERRHREIIERFGRYPHRNAILGRESTSEERAFLQQAGSGF
ncbi:DUF924 family protein [Algiphilus sp.]|uniref:DUF924 family protein n=1 Tax=Algiphilus sp. TaxID=1872431 RepID=UPI002A624150|nr:DUF924 domain-containing protein [Pseudomonadota bacterium]